MTEFLVILLTVSIIIAAIQIHKNASLKAQIDIRVEEKSQEWQRQAEARLQRQVQLRVQEWSEQEMQKIKAIAQKEAIEQAQKAYQSWCERELESIRREQRSIATEEATNRLIQWKVEQEGLIRKDAALRSQAVTLGKVTEHLIPYLPEFSYNPKDARFVSSPIDFIIFDGLNDEEGEIREIVFVEIKTGKSGLSQKQRKVRDAIQARRVRWEEMRVNRELQQAAPQLFR